MNFKNFLPKDTLATELTSAGILFLSMLLALLGFIDPHEVLQSLHMQILFITIPILHLISLTTTKLHAVRVHAALLTGGLMVYLGFLNIGSYSFIGSISTIVLGFSNFYAFIVNNQRLR